MPGRRWPDELVEQIIALFYAGMSDKDIKTTLNLDYSVCAIRNKRAHANLVSHKRREAMRVAQAEKRAAKAGSRDSREASIWHLVDLKRAGHSPTRTELYISRDGLPMQFRADPCVMYRSPAAAVLEG